MQVAAAASQNLITPPLNLQKVRIVPAMPPSKKKDWETGIGTGKGKSTPSATLPSGSIPLASMSFSVSPEDISDLFCHFGYFLAFFDEF